MPSKTRMRLHLSMRGPLAQKYRLNLSGSLIRTPVEREQNMLKYGLFNNMSHYTCLQTSTVSQTTLPV